MAQTFTGRKRVRKFFGKIQEVAEMPNLIEVQKASYDQFLLVREPVGGRPDEGLQAVFKSVFPISDFSNTSMLEFVKYEFEAPKYDVDECRQRGMTYAAPLKVTLRLIVFDVDEETGAKSVKDIKEQDVYMGDIPLMTNNGTFIVNGTERVIVSQMHRSPGVFFDHDKGKTHSSGKLLFAARIIPYRGSWLDIEFDAKDIVYARIDRRRKIPVTSLLFALGLDGYFFQAEDGIRDVAVTGVQTCALPIYFVVPVKRQGIHVYGNRIARLRRGGFLGTEEFACPLIVMHGFGCRGGVQWQIRLESRGKGQQMGGGIVDGNSLEMLALAIALDQAVQGPLLAAAQLMLHAFLEALGQNFRTAREVVTQDAALVSYLVAGKEERHAGDAHDQGQDDFQGRAHLKLLNPKRRWTARGWVQAALLN